MQPSAPPARYKLRSKERRGLYYVKGGTEFRICDYIKVCALAPDIDGWYCIIKFRDHDNHRRFLLIREDKRLNPKLIDDLAKEGFDVPAGASDMARLHEYLRSARPNRRMAIARFPGWHGEVYVLPDVIVGRDKASIIYWPWGTELAAAQKQTKGTLRSWRRNVAKPSLSSSRLVFSIAAAFAPPLLRLRKRESYLIVLHGRTSRGKTTAEIVARSVFGLATREGLQSWDITPARLEELAQLYCDQLLIIDDMARLGEVKGDPSKLASAFIYQIAGQVAKERSKRFFDSSSTLQWRVIVLTSSEYSLEKLARDANHTRKPGEKVRVIDLPADPGKGFGIFDRLPKGAGSADHFSKRLEQACQENYGTPIRAFVPYLIDQNRQDLDRQLDDYEAEFFKAIGFDTQKPGATRRYVEKFSLVYAAGCLAIDAKILPWEKKAVLRACRRCYLAAQKASRGDDDSITPLEDSAAKLKAAIIAADAADVQTDIEFQTDPKHGAFAAVLSGTLEGTLVQPTTQRQLFGHLEKHGFLITGSGGKTTRQLSINGQRRRYVCIRSAFWK